MNILSSLAAAVQAPNGGFSFRKVLSELPTDPASLFTILLMLGSIGLVVWFGRPKGGSGGKPA